MKHVRLYFIFCVGLLLCGAVTAQNKGPQKLDLQHADLLQVILSSPDTTVATGSVSFQTETGTIICDSAVWVKGRRAKLIGSVMVEDTSYRLIADTVDYDLRTGAALAKGKYVELFSRIDSLYAVGTHAFYDRPKRYFRMEHRPTMYFNYPDSARMIEVVSDQFEYAGADSLATATGNVVITSQKVFASAGKAEMRPKGDTLKLYDHPVLKREQSTVSGNFITILTQHDQLARILVVDSARAEFKEPVPLKGEETKEEQQFDQSILTGSQIVFDFKYGELNTITSTGQAYSWYYPASRGSNETNENTVSGDSIFFHFQREKLQDVVVVGGATGSYYNTKVATKDTVVTTTKDTVNYTAQHIAYSLQDSTITLTVGSHVTSGTVELDAQRINFDTHRRIIKAYSANVVTDSTQTDTTFTERYQPNPIPVVLKDKDQQLFGDFLEYSIDTQKGRIVQSKSQYQTGFYYGQNVYRAQKDVFYVDNGRYTTCDADEPHFHFYSKHMKMIENDKLIAKPVVLFVGRLPILALPYYVFPLKKGRHSGILPFRIGNLQGGNRYIENLGYFWSPSDYLDLLNGISYYEGRDAVKFSSQFRYKKIYVLDGNVSGELTKETDYDQRNSTETKSTRWVLRGAHSQQFTPTFKMSGSGQYLSDRTYYKDYSANLNDRLNNNIVGRVSLDKKFGKDFSLSATMSHTKYLQTGNQIDQLENAGLRFPTIQPFGAGKINEEGVLQPRWFNNITLVPTLRFTYYSDRIVNFTQSSRIDTLTDTIDGIPRVDTIVDSSGRFGHRKYASASTSFPFSQNLKVLKYLNLTPNASYSETWVYVFRTAQSDSLGIRPDFYRTYQFSTGIGTSTTLYGTVNPNVFGIVGLRQSLTPRLGYTFVPKINRHPEVRRFTGLGYATERQSQSISMQLDQLYQAKVKSGETEKSLNLFSISTSTSYDFEDTLRPWSDLVTTVQSSVLPKITLYGQLIHDLYKPGTNTLRFFSPSVKSLSLDASVSLSGKRFFFDDEEDKPVIAHGADSASQVPLTTSPTARLGTTSQGWRISASYSYRESGRGAQFSKSSQIQLNMGFNLSPSTTLSYYQYYDIAKGQTVNRQINITKQLHCWTGQIYWVPTGSNKGYGFQLYVTAIPALKIDNSQTGSIAGSLMQNMQ